MRSPCSRNVDEEIPGGWKKPGQEVEQSVAQGSAQSTSLSGNVDFSSFLAHRLKCVR